MQPTSKQLMDHSLGFRILFWGSIVCVALGALLCVFYTFTICNGFAPGTCSYYYGTYSIQCTNATYNTTYCCTAGFGTCGSSLCIQKPPFVQKCTGVIITGGSLIGIGFFFGIFVFMMFFNYRSKLRTGAYVNMMYDEPLNDQPEIQIEKDQHIDLPKHEQQFEEEQEQRDEISKAHDMITETRERE